jgi:hypothetical protein
MKQPKNTPGGLGVASSNLAAPTMNSIRFGSI